MITTQIEQAKTKLQQFQGAKIISAEEVAAIQKEIQEFTSKPEAIVEMLKKAHSNPKNKILNNWLKFWAESLNQKETSPETTKAVA